MKTILSLDDSDTAAELYELPSTCRSARTMIEYAPQGLIETTPLCDPDWLARLVVALDAESSSLIATGLAKPTIPGWTRRCLVVVFLALPYASAIQLPAGTENEGLGV